MFLPLSALGEFSVFGAFGAFGTLSALGATTVQKGIASIRIQARGGLLVRRHFDIQAACSPVVSSQ